MKSVGRRRWPVGRTENLTAPGRRVSNEVPLEGGGRGKKRRQRRVSGSGVAEGRGGRGPAPTTPPPPPQLLMTVTIVLINAQPQAPPSRSALTRTQPTSQLGARLTGGSSHTGHKYSAGKDIQLHLPSVPIITQHGDRLLSVVLFEEACLPAVPGSGGGWCQEYPRPGGEDWMP